MKGGDLLSIWEAPDNSRLTPKQVSLRLPIHVAARIAALCDMYPRKTKTEIMGDLLGAALDQIQDSFPDVKGKLLGPADEDNLMYEDTGPRASYIRLANKHYQELEKELGNEKPSPLFDYQAVVIEPQK